MSDSNAAIYKSLYDLLLARGYEEDAAKELIIDLHAQVDRADIHKTVRLKSKTVGNAHDIYGPTKRSEHLTKDGKTITTYTRKFT